MVYALLSAAVVLIVAVGAVAVIRPGPVDRLLRGESPIASASPTPPPLDPPPVLEVATGQSVASTAGLTAVLQPLLADSRLGGHVAVSVVDAPTGKSLYSADDTALVMPASTTKLVTAAALLASRGPSYRIPTSAVAGSAPGEVVLIGGGDPTLSVNGRGTYPGAARLDQLAAQARKALNGVAPTKVLVDASLYTGPATGPGWDSDIVSGGFSAPVSALMIDGGRVSPKQNERSGTPDLAAGAALARLLGLPPSAVGRGTAPAGAAVLGRVESPPASRLVELMLSASDNIIAECLARQVALARSAPASFAGAAGAIRSQLGELGVPVAGDGLVDGSGLSRTDRLSATLLTSILTAAAGPSHPELRPIFAGLPVAGYSGTLTDRYTDAAKTGAGLVRAKTGTLSGASSLSGIVIGADGRPMVFALLADQVPVGGTLGAEAALDRIAAALATCGCR